MDNRLLSELQMLTGVVTDDIDYLVYLLLKEGSYFDKSIKIEEKSNVIKEIVAPSIDDWFSGFEEVK